MQLGGLAKVISKVGYSIAGLTFVTLTIKLFVTTDGLSAMDIIGQLLHIFMIAVTLIVVSVPEGLPMSVTLSLALSMNRMLKNNNLVRKMHACETMGATTVICTDKTGTLTQNQMQVYETRFFNLRNQQLSDNETSDLVKEGISVNTTAYLDLTLEPIKTIGNPTEAALLLWLQSQYQDYMSLRASAEIIDQLTFSTERKYMATLVHSPLLNKRVLYVKGAPEIVLSHCTQIAQNNTLEPVTDAIRSDIEQQLLAYQNKAMRTLGFGYRILENDVAKIGRSHV